MDFNTMTLTEHEDAFTANEGAIAKPLEGYRDARGTNAFLPDAVALSDEEIVRYTRRQRLIAAARSSLSSYRASLDDLNGDGFPSLPPRKAKAAILAAFDETLATIQAARDQLEEAEPEVTGGTLTFSSTDEP